MVPSPYSCMHIARVVLRVKYNLLSPRCAVIKMNTPILIKSDLCEGYFFKQSRLGGLKPI